MAELSSQYSSISARWPLYHDARCWSGSGSMTPHSYLCQRCKGSEVKGAREIVCLSCASRAAAARPRGHGGGTRAVHPGRAYCCGPATPRPASARGPRRSAPHWRWCNAGRARVGRDQGGTGTSATGHAMDARGLDGLAEGHRRPEGGEPPRQHRLAGSEITSHCRHYYSLSLLSPHGPLQQRRLKASRGSGQAHCRLKRPRASMGQAGIAFPARRGRATVALRRGGVSHV
jgi:hypothetical protein